MGKNVYPQHRIRHSPIMSHIDLLKRFGDKIDNRTLDKSSSSIILARDQDGMTISGYIDSDNENRLKMMMSRINNCYSIKRSIRYIISQYIGSQHMYGVCYSLPLSSGYS